MTIPLRSHKAAVTCITFSQDQSQFVTTSLDGTAKLWQTQSRQIKHIFSHGKIGEVPLLTASFSYDGRYVATGGKDSKAIIWDVVTGEVWQEFKTTEKEIYSCLLYTSPSPRDPKTSRMPSSA